MQCHVGKILMQEEVVRIVLLQDQTVHKVWFHSLCSKQVTLISNASIRSITAGSSIGPSLIVGVTLTLQADLLGSGNRANIVEQPVSSNDNATDHATNFRYLFI